MELFLEVLSALGAAASIASLVWELWQEYKRDQMEDGRKSE